MSRILALKQAEYPEYELAFIPDSFPVEIAGGTMHEGVSLFDQPIMSTHVLYITDYEKHLCKVKRK